MIFGITVEHTQYSKCCQTSFFSSNKIMYGIIIFDILLLNFFEILYVKLIAILTIIFVYSRFSLHLRKLLQKSNNNLFKVPTIFYQNSSLL